MIGILGSAVGFGHYVPALNLQRELAAVGIESTVLVFESYLSDEQRQALVRMRSAYQRNLSLVRMRHKLPLKTQPLLPAHVDQIDLANVDRVVVIGGFWIPVLVELARQQRFQVDVLHVDSVSSPSWDAVREGVEQLQGERFWLSNHASGRIEHRIDAGVEIVPWERRSNAVLAHGGGWSVGTYRDACARIADAEYAAHVILPETAGVPAWAAAIYRVDPAWEAWSLDTGPPSFPPLLGQSAELGPRTDGARNDVLEVGRKMLAFVSKPGGSTILDCIETATPLIYAEPEGAHEAKNAELWRTLGFAMPVGEWEATGFSREPLERMHEKLLRARREIPTYAQRRILDAS